MGIPADRLDVIFEPFERLANASDVEGTGLGLALARRLTEAMGGELSVQSSLGAGSTFMVDLESTQLPDDDVGPPPPGPRRTRAL